MNKQQLFLYVALQLVLIAMVCVTLVLNLLVHSLWSAIAVFLSAVAAFLMAIGILVAARRIDHNGHPKSINT